MPTQSSRSRLVSRQRLNSNRLKGNKPDLGHSSFQITVVRLAEPTL